MSQISVLSDSNTNSNIEQELMTEKCLLEGYRVILYFQVSSDI